MHWGKRGPGSPSKRRRLAFRPDSESLEGRRLLATFDLTTTQTKPLGVEFVGQTASTAGYTVTDVGNVTGSGYDSFVVSATGLQAESNISLPGINQDHFSSESAAYLVFGSKQVNLNTVASYLTLANGVPGANGELTSGNRAGDLTELGTLGTAAAAGFANPTAQTNPTVAQPQPNQASTHVYGFNFDGLTLVTGLNSTTGLGSGSALGFSVAALGDINNSGFDSFAISAPNDTGGGRVFVVYGGTALATQAVATKTIDLEPTAGVINATTPTKVVSLYDSVANASANVGFSIAGLGNYFGNSSSTHDLAIGAPGLNVGSLAFAGSVFTVTGTYLNSLAAGANVDLNTLYAAAPAVPPNTVAGIEYTGYALGQEVGTSVSTAGNFDGATGTNGSAIDDLLIGAPNTSGGLTFLVYGTQAYLPNQQIGSIQSLATLGVAPVTTPVQTYPLQGVVFGDQTAGDQFGYSVATAGDFNADGVDDIMVGAPNYLTGTGYVEVIYGVKGTATTTTSTRLNGQFIINPLTATTGLTQASFIGEGINDYAGYSIAPSGHVQIGTTTTAQPTSDILIGSPGIIQAAYLVPGTGAGVKAKTGTNLLSAINTTLGGNEFTVTGTSDPAISNSGFARSVSARNLVVDPNAGSNTVDPDNVPDLFFGAPFSTLNSPTNPLTQSRINAGVAYVVEGGLIGGTSTGGTTGGGGGGSGGTAAGTVVTSFNVLVNSLAPVVYTGVDNGLPNPPLSQLSHLISYSPLPVQIAYQQYLPAPGFLAREQVALHPSQKGSSHQAAAGTILNVAAIRHSEDKYAAKNTLDQQIRTRGKFKIGRKTTFTHHVKVVPRNEQTETFSG